MNTKLLMILTFLIIGLVFVSCSDDGITPAKNKIKIAAILDLSGHYSQFGQEAKQGMNQFLQDYPDSKFEVTYYDSKADAAIAINLFNTISTDTSNKAVVTLASWISNAIAPLAKEKNILHFAIGSAVFEFPANGNTVRYTGDVSDESTYLLNYLKDFQKIGLMYFDNDYGKGWKERLSTNLGSKLILTKSYTDTDTDFTGILQEMKVAAPEVIVLISTKEAVQICKQAKSLNITAKLLGNRPILTDSLLKEPAAEGLIFSYPDLNENYAGYKNYVTKYSRKPSSFAAEGYDIAASFYGFTQVKGFDRTTVYNSYKNLTQFGIFSELNFNDNAQANSKYSLMVIKSGDYIELK
jgi:ABC-type branched-subunit amino acid transport system substrate-binding protein